MFDFAKVASDPVGFVLDMAWADLTDGGRAKCEARLAMLVADKAWAEALVLAVAMDQDQERRKQAEVRWHAEKRLIEEMRRPQITAADIDAALVPPPPAIE